MSARLLPPPPPPAAAVWREALAVNDAAWRSDRPCRQATGAKRGKWKTQASAPPGTWRRAGSGSNRRTPCDDDDRRKWERGDLARFPTTLNIKVFAMFDLELVERNATNSCRVRLAPRRLRLGLWGFFSATDRPRLTSFGRHYCTTQKRRNREVIYLTVVARRTTVPVDG